MKQTLLAPLLSAFILPGMGQIVNKDYRKGGLLIAGVSLLFLALFIMIVIDLNRVIRTLPGDVFEKNPPSFSFIAETLSRQSHPGLYLFLLLLGLVWAYSIWDAYTVARKNEMGGS
jgi:hypothetical protein